MTDLPAYATRHNESPYQKLLGIVTEEVRPGYARATCRVRPELIHEGGVLNGGVIAAMADIALVMALFSDERVQPPAPTIQLSVSFLAPAREGDLAVAEAHILRRGNHVAFGEVNVTNGTTGQLIARASASCSVRLVQPSGD
ncbi:MAG: PaaI family thioesterase [Chloroflexota bacterium]